MSDEIKVEGQSFPALLEEHGLDFVVWWDDDEMVAGEVDPWLAEHTSEQFDNEIIVTTAQSLGKLLRRAYVHGMDKCREIKEAYGDWPSLPGRMELAADEFPPDVFRTKDDDAGTLSAGCASPESERKA